ncbi:MAG: HDIG domain-containing protein [Desulfovibrio sp.]|jgi:putative nucleotidyltransferase with HDIG domain|nr:HDIG domain-containing protein [Desulfovibrio sp.]
MTARKKADNPVSLFLLVRRLKAHHRCGWGICFLVGTLFFLSVLAGLNFNVMPRMYVSGQVAESDVIAEHDIMVEDGRATEARRKQLLLLQPPVYDLSMEPFAAFQNKIMEILRVVNETGERKHAAESLAHLMEDLIPDVAEEILAELARYEVQDYLLKDLMPLIRENLAEGLVADLRSGRVGRAGVVIRNLDTGTETLRPDVGTLHDAQSFLAEIASRNRQNPGLTPQSRRAVNIVLAAIMPASLTPNREATQKRAESVAESVKPVYYQVQKGEMIVRKGERVSREQQIKLQALHESVSGPMRWTTAGGGFLCALLVSIGFFVSPSGRPGTPLHSKDMLMISLLLLLTGIGTKALCLFGLRLDSLHAQNAFAFAFPVAGVVGLVAMIFAARRYCTTGLLLAFFTTLMFQGEYTLFLYHFLGGMLGTWLMVRAQNRQDVVWSIVPLAVGQSVIWAGAALLANVSFEEVPFNLIAVAVNSIFSLIVLFAASPVIEMLFGYSTRFRLMELMSLEQPLMQEMMMAIPGTYHHSLVVANMVEAGCKVIGANSLLCKVAALYHDVGKLGYPEYYIENQHGGPNKHDKIAPSLSVLILLSHVKKGIEFAERYNLGREITDIIQQHHGTRLIQFFYQKAQKLGEKPREPDYCYPGPRPQSREAAILMLADSVEASSRTLADPTPARIRSHINSIIKGIFSEGQLDESELTFKDLHYLSENFQRILTGIFHQRIVYPEAGISNMRQGSKTSAEARAGGDRERNKIHSFPPPAAEPDGKARQDASATPAARLVR